jgi:hypothetical protein
MTGIIDSQEMLGMEVLAWSKQIFEHSWILFLAQSTKYSLWKNPQCIQACVQALLYEFSPHGKDEKFGEHKAVISQCCALGPCRGKQYRYGAKNAHYL